MLHQRQSNTTNYIKNLTLGKSEKRHQNKIKWKTDRQHHCQQKQSKQIENIIATTKKRQTVKQRSIKKREKNTKTNDCAITQQIG